jgi:hypothetical protein
MASYRETENEEETEESRQESRIRIELLLEEREENEKLMRAMDAFEHAKMIPNETGEERFYQCCKKGRVILAPLKECPESLRKLF